MEKQLVAGVFSSIPDLELKTEMMGQEDQNMNPSDAKPDTKSHSAARSQQDSREA